VSIPATVIISARNQIIPFILKSFFEVAFDQLVIDQRKNVQVRFPMIFFSSLVSGKWKRCISIWANVSNEPEAPTR
jgi:hypothetical protein